MYYLEDFMDNIETLPDIIKKDLMEMGKLDGEIESSMEHNDRRIDFLLDNSKKMTNEELNRRYEKIVEDCEISVEKSENKIKLANRMHTLLSKHLKQLDNDLHSMKMELEVNNSGITEIIERNVLEEEKSATNNTASQNENKEPTKKGSLEGKKKVPNNNKNLKIKSTTTASHTVTSESLKNISQQDTNSPMDLAKEPLKTNSTDIEEIASKAVIHIKKQPSHKRSRSNKSKKSRKTVKHKQPLTDQVHCDVSGKSSDEILINEELAPVSELINPDMEKTTEENELIEIQETETSANDDEQNKKDVLMEELDESKKMTYCICKYSAYGMMIACDNKQCEIEWFHYECVGISNPPKGKWYCPQCSVKMKNRKSNK